MVVKFSKKDERVFEAFCLVALESKHPKEITMSKIAQKLGITRQALHKTYYADVNDIINLLHLYVNQEIEIEIKQIVKKFPRNWEFHFAMDILPLLYEKREYFCVLFGNVGDPSWHQYLEDEYSNTLIPYLSGIDKANVDVIFVSKVIIRRIAGIVAMWLCSPNPKSPIEFASTFLYFVRHSTSDMTHG